MSACVYKNLRLGNWSIAAVAGTDNRGKVIGHESAVCLANVRFVVKENARQRVCRVKQREVHAWCVGDIVDMPAADLPSVRISYNPYRCGNFTTADGAAITAAEYVAFGADGSAVAFGKICH
jgi:hypothetical protein